MILQGPGVPYRLRLYEPEAQGVDGTLRFEMYGYDESILPAVQEFLFSENKIGDDFFYEYMPMTPEQVEDWQYLKRTDWYAIRLSEIAEPMPAEVEDRRESARLVLSNE